MQNKLERLLRYHRQNVFNDGQDGERHQRALYRLKKTKTFAAMCKRNVTSDNNRRSARLLQSYA